MLQSTNHNFSWFANHFEEITEDLKLTDKYMKFRGEEILNKRNGKTQGCKYRYKMVNKK